ncbi:hypothetical protein FBEOM_14643 [Fusarium beomiforme]|uniref:Uncharacterized protein n=1 Tax=Fusarium beomiforme TaxID=44412 RepID=A0A9P5DKS2_9HYPO|nr:hypothetical protein FBEOM_14643 [Fusarium beomiforme]
MRTKRSLIESEAVTCMKTTPAVFPAQAEADSILTKDSSTPRLTRTEGRFEIPIMSSVNQQRANSSEERRLVSKAIRAAGKSCIITIDPCFDKGSYVRARSSPMSLVMSTSDLVSTSNRGMMYTLHSREVCGSISCDNSVPRAHTSGNEVRTSSEPHQGYIFDSTIYVHDDAESESSESESGLSIRNRSSRPSQGSLHESSKIHEIVEDKDIDKESEASGSGTTMGVSVRTIPMKSSIVASTGKGVDHRPVAHAATMAVLAILTKGDAEDLLRGQ